MIRRSKLPAIRRRLSLGVAAVFAFFLAASAPHRVHHFFEQLSGAGHKQAAQEHDHAHADGERHSHRDDHSPSPRQQSDCFVLSVAQNAHASLVQCFELGADRSAVMRLPDAAVAASIPFNPSPFSQRAPPQL